MDRVTRRNTAGSARSTAHRQKRPARKPEAEGDRRRLIQLVVSLTLFLLVYVGRGVFPNQIEVWRSVLTSDVDFQAAFQEFGRAVSAGETVHSAFEQLCVTVFGGEVDDPREEPKNSDLMHVVRLSPTPRAGLSYLTNSGALAGRLGQSGKDPLQTETDPPVASADPAASEPPVTTEDPVESGGPVLPQEPTASADPVPTAAVVTAVAQTYDSSGRTLPSNVSFAFYELGLEETVNPVTGPVSSGFGYRDSPINGKYEFHLALDIVAEEGTPIGAYADGVVRYIGESDEFGQYFMIDHANNVSTFYAHCSKLLVHKGDVVTCGQTVALVGHTGNATGSHLHLTILKDNIRLDPAYYVDLP